MTERLSQEQRAILCLALTINAATQYGRPAVKSGKSLGGYRVPAIDYVGATDLSARILLWALSDARLLPTVGSDHGARFTHTRESRCTRASLFRSLARLIKRGALVFVPNDYKKQGLPWYNAARFGYVLTAEGFSLAGNERFDIPGLSAAIEFFNVTTVQAAGDCPSNYKRRQHLLNELKRLPRFQRRTAVTTAAFDAVVTGGNHAIRLPASNDAAAVTDAVVIAEVER